MTRPLPSPGDPAFVVVRGPARVLALTVDFVYPNPYARPPCVESPDPRDDATAFPPFVAAGGRLYDPRDVYPTRDAALRQALDDADDAIHTLWKHRLAEMGHRRELAALSE